MASRSIFASGSFAEGLAVYVTQVMLDLGFPAAARDSTWNAEAEKLVGYWQRQEAIPWVDVHDLPTHVQFPHVSHVRVGIQCQTCHGPVEEMEEVYQFSSLQMGWCISCHRGEIPLSEAEQATIQERSTYVQRLASLLQLGHNMSVDLYLAKTVAHARLVVVRLLQRRRQMYEPFGRLVLGVLLLQDVLFLGAIANFALR